MVSAPSLRLLSERTHSPAHTAAGRTGNPLVSAPSRADQNLHDPQPRSDKPRETSLRWFPKAPPPANGWPLIGERGGGRGRGFSPRPPLKVLLCRSHTLACFPRGYRLGLKAERGGWVGRLCLSRAEAGLSRPWLSTLWGDLSGRPDRSSLRLIGNKR